MKSSNKPKIKKGNKLAAPWQYNTVNNNWILPKEEAKTTERQYDLYMKIKNKQETEERENEEYIRRLEDGLRSEYKYYQNRKDGKGFSAEYVIQEATNIALDKVKKL